MGEEKRKSSLTKSVVGAVLLLAITIGTLALIPFQTCPTCAGKGQVTVMKYMPQTCPMCDGKGKTNLLKDWFQKHPSELIR
jgi:hypothetical protein